MQNTAQQRQSMIDGQLTPNEVLSDALLDIIAEVPREMFVPEAFAGAAYVDEDIPLGHGRYLMEAVVLCRLFQELPSEKVNKMMIIGGATGYSSAMASRLVEKVIMVEELGDFAETARKSMSQLNIENVEVMSSPLHSGYNAAAPYDVIFIEGAVEEIPEVVFDQLSPSGMLLTVECLQARPGSELGLGRAVKYQMADKQLDKHILFDASVARLVDFKQSEAFTL